MSLETYKGKVFDSREEVWMAMWLEELKEAGFIDWWNKITAPVTVITPYRFVYKQKKKTKIFTLLKGLEYTPDFEVVWSQKGMDTFVSTIGDENADPKSWFFAKFPTRQTYVEVKPTFDQHGKTARFSIMQKVLWEVRQMFVDLIIVEDLFEGTFMPKEAVPEFKYKIKSKAGQWKTKYIPKTLNEFLNA